ncbi:MAG: dockerin type I repeat-containing protein [Oscillospiraceae bacterium]|nr:dockerin type I repeat-containing protein [Oscillospiraceae bacterium]
MFRRTKKIAALAAAIAVIASCSGITFSDSPSVPFTAQAADTGSRIRVDINKNDGRKASYARNANNWILVEGASPSYQVNGVTFTLSNGGSAGGDVTGANNKKLQLQSLEYPYLTMDGAKIKDGDNGGVLKLEINGLSNGNHSLQMWHCNTDGYTNSSLSISVNGKKVLSGVNCPTNVKDENDAGISYVTWSGSSVTILITPEGGGRQDVAWLNAFELDGSDPVNGVSKMYPDDQCAHLDASQGLSWTAGKNAQSHDVYIGTSYSDVFNADRNSKEFKGNQTATKYTLDDSYSSIPTYYWRVDEVNSSGTVKGAVYSFQINRLSFPTAEGYGRFARGGRGGYVYHVTNLNDSGEGSLRYGLETLKGARTIVFDVGGVISLNSVLCIPDDGGDVYVAGQTAPGDGITLINYTFGAMGSKDVVIRDIRTRVGDVSGKSMGGMGMSSCNNSIVDHCSISWGTDEGFSSRSAANLTFQWNIIGESLNNSVHYNADDRTDVERHAFAASISGYTGSFHHNLLIHNTGRNWSLAGAMEQDAVTYGGQLDIRNNVVYNWKDRTTDGGARRVNFVNNYYKAGPVSNTDMHIVSIDGNELNTSDMQKMYVSGNIMTDINGNQLLRATDDAWAMGKAVSGGKNSTDADVRSDTPFFESYVNTQSAEDAYNSVITSAGANKPGFDYIDSRYLKEVKNGTYTYTGSKDNLQGIIDSQTDVRGYPTNSTFKGGTTPKDTDQDGMPDAWESEHGLNPNDGSDGAIVSLSADDYTNLEMYLNELAGDPVEYNGNITRDPITGKLIKSIEVLDTAYYSSWGIDTSLETGDKVFGDRDIEKSAFSEVPDKYMGAELVLTPCDSKNSDKQQAELTAAENITVYVGFDSRIIAVPSWVNGWKKESDTIRTTNGITFEMYSKELKANETITLGANGQASGVVNYIVLAAEEKIVPGDLNRDERIDVFDLAVYRQFILGNMTLEGTALANADINGDGARNTADYLLLQKFLLGQIEKFEQ